MVSNDRFEMRAIKFWNMSFYLSVGVHKITLRFRHRKKPNFSPKDRK